MTQEQQPQQQEQEADKVKLSASSSSAPQPLSYWALVPTRDDDEDESVLVVTGGDGQEDDDNEVEVEKNPSLSLQCVPDHDRLRQDLTGIYEYYSALYPNPAVLRILHEQQQKQQQRRANESSSPKGRSSSSLSSSFWNKIWRFCGRSERQHETEPLQQQQPFVEESPSRSISNDNSNNSNNNNHNHHVLDTTCIPLEAHAMARFCLASQSPMARQPLNPCRVCSLQEDDDENNNNKSTTMMFLIGLGQVLEMQQQQNEQQQRQVQSTSDQIALHAFLQQQGILFRLDYARGVLIEPNILIVSWGLLDGMVQIYHRQRQQRPPGGGAVVTVWQSVATLSPTATRMAPPVSSSLQQQQQQQPLLSAMWLVTDLLPLVVAQEEPVQHHSSSPAENATSYYSAPVVKLAVARLGTPVELIPLPRSLWLLLLPEQQGDDSKTNGSAAPAVKWLFSSFPIFRGLGQQPSSSSFETTTRRTTKKTKKAFQPPPQHYAFGLPNLSQSNQVLTVAKTAQYHSNVLGLASFSTSRFVSSLQQQHSSTAATSTTANRPDWNTELYPYHPPAEHVLIMFGGGGETGTGGEQMSFWSVSTRSAEGNQDDDDDYHFSLQCVLLERLTVMGSSSGLLSSNNSYSLGPDWTLFATHEIWQNWRAAVAVPQPTEPHHMEMSETLEPTTTTTTTSTTTMEIISALNMAAATISVPRPIVNVQCCPVVPETGVLLVAILDANGGVTCMDCARLERLASHTLFPEEHDRIFASQQQQHCEGVEMVRPPPPPLSLVTVLADRARIHALLSRNVVGPSSSSSSGSELHVPSCYVQALQV